MILILTWNCVYTIIHGSAQGSESIAQLSDEIMETIQSPSKSYILIFKGGDTSDLGSDLFTEQ